MPRLRTCRPTPRLGAIAGGAALFLLSTSAHAAWPSRRPAKLTGFAPSIQVGRGLMAWSPTQDTQAGSFHLGVGPKFYNGNWTGADPKFGLYLYPSIGVRAEPSALAQRYAEFALEAGAGPSIRDGTNTWTPVTLGYRVVGLAGTIDRDVGAPVYSTGLRHGPVLGLFAGVITVDVSHETITRPELTHGVRVGVSFELNPFIWLMTGIW